MYTISEVAAKLNIAEKTIRNKISAGTITQFRRVAGRTIRFNDEDLQALIQLEDRRPTPPKKTGNTGPRTGNDHRIDAILQRACSAEGVN